MCEYGSGSLMWKRRLTVAAVALINDAAFSTVAHGAGV
jgi:hypothetical protein